MPNGIDVELRALFLHRAQLYVDSKPAVKQFVDNHAILGKIAEVLLARELRIAQSKRNAFLELIKLLTTKPEVELHDLRSQSSRVSNVTEETCAPLRRVSYEVLVQTPTSDYYARTPSISHSFLELEKTLQRMINALQIIRGGHPRGQAEGLLHAMHKATNYMVRIYNRRANHIVQNIDTINDNSEAVLQLYAFLALFLCKFAYDRELSKYNESADGHVIHEHYYMGTGVEQLPASARDKLFVMLDKQFKLLAEVYTILKILTAKIKNSDADVCADLRALHINEEILAQVACNDRLYLPLLCIFTGEVPTNNELVNTRTRFILALCLICKDIKGILKQIGVFKEGQDELINVIFSKDMAAPFAQYPSIIQEHEEDSNSVVSVLAAAIPDDLQAEIVIMRETLRSPHILRKVSQDPRYRINEHECNSTPGATYFEPHLAIRRAVSGPAILFNSTRQNTGSDELLRTRCDSEGVDNTTMADAAYARLGLTHG